MSARPGSIVTVQRFALVPPHLKMGTFGELTLPTVGSDEGFKCFTVEQDWEANQPRLSCIPAGLYEMRLGRYNRGGYPAWELQNVPGRTLIKIHRANTLNDLLGCIGTGKGLGYVDGKWAVTRSKDAFEEFMTATTERFGDQCWVEVKDPELVTTTLKQEGAGSDTVSLIFPRGSTSLPICVWRYDSAPPKWKDLSSHGGDEDWLAYVPEGFPDPEPMWMEEGTRFGCCDVQKVKVRGGTIHIGAHA